MGKRLGIALLPLMLAFGCGRATLVEVPRGAPLPEGTRLQLGQLLGSRAEWLLRLDRVSLVTSTGRGIEGFAAGPPRSLAEDFESRLVTAVVDLPENRAVALRDLLLDPASYRQGVALRSGTAESDRAWLLHAGESVLVLRRTSSPDGVRLGSPGLGETALELTPPAARVLDTLLAPP